MARTWGANPPNTRYFGRFGRPIASRDRRYVLGPCLLPIEVNPPDEGAGERCKYLFVQNIATRPAWPYPCN